MQNAGFPTKRKGKLLHSCDGNQFVVKNTGEGEQIVALVLQRDAPGGSAVHLRARGAPIPRRRNRTVSAVSPGPTGQRENVVAQPLDERPHVAGQPAGFGLGLPRRTSSPIGEVRGDDA
jgi:hypothetical protein